MRDRVSPTHDGVWIHPLEDPTLLHNIHQRAVFEYWMAARATADVPPPSRIDPVELPRGSLPSIVVKECEPDTGRYRTRLAGTAFREATGFDSTHSYSDQISGNTGTVDRFNWAVANRRPYWYQGPLAFSLRNFKKYSVLVLPFAEPGGPIARLLCVLDFEPDASP